MDLLAIQVTQEQRDFIEEVFKSKGWDLKVVDPKEITQSGPGDGDGGGEGGFFIPPQEDSEECIHCLSAPCVTNERYRQLWWKTEPVNPHRQNRTVRKTIYKRFWVMLLHRGVWGDPRYRARKRMAMEGDRQLFAWSGPDGCHPRDIMPECVLNLVRGWLPNPPSQPYMGHKWQ